MTINRRVFDLETDGLLDDVTVVHCLVIRDTWDGTVHVFNNQPGGRPVTDGLALLSVEALTAEGARIAAHNGIDYDLRVLRKLYGYEIPWTYVDDTLVMSRLIWANMRDVDLENIRKRASSYAGFPPKLAGSHKLEAWGHRLGILKGEYVGDPTIWEGIADGADRTVAKRVAFAERWKSWNKAMEDYCVQDVAVTCALLDLIDGKKYSAEALRLEHQVAHIVNRQHHHGFQFNTEKAIKLYGVLASRRVALEQEVREVFQPRYLRHGKVFAPARDNDALGYVKGARVTKVKLTEFNPSSRDHVAHWLRVQFGWIPAEMTADGRPKVDDEIIDALPYPEAKPLKEYFMVVKRIGQLAEGDRAWLKLVKADGRIHGRVNTNGAVTGRMTHQDPNTGQVPSGRSPYGHECRELFEVPSNKLQVGCDADALELRDLAGYMARYDNGAYIRTVLEGDKSRGTDMHSVNCRALGMDPKAKQWNGESGRDVAKTWFYAFIYGAGDGKLGGIQSGLKGEAAKKIGAAGRASFLKNIQSMGVLVNAVKQAARGRGYLRGLDGRHLHVRSQHAALNTLLQSAGAVQMKRALCILDDDLQRKGYVPGKHYEFIANVHDEWQIEVDPDIAEDVGKTAKDAIRKSGESFGFACPLAGNSAIGRNWNECH